MARNLAAAYGGLIFIPPLINRPPALARISLKAPIRLAILPLVAMPVRDAETAIVAGLDRIGTLAIDPTRAALAVGMRFCGGKVAFGEVVILATCGAVRG